MGYAGVWVYAVVLQFDRFGIVWFVVGNFVLSEEWVFIMWLLIYCPIWVHVFGGGLRVALLLFVLRLLLRVSAIADCVISASCLFGFGFVVMSCVLGWLA